MNPEFLVPLAAGLYGLVFGSFANVCIHRLPRDRSVVWPRSACPACGRPIAWYDNIPVLSWIVLMGKCRGCRRPISPRYPAVELLIGAIFALAAARHSGHWVDVVSEALFGWAMVILIFTDLDHRILPDQVTLGGILVGLALSPWRTETGFVASAIGVAAGGGVLWGIGAAYQAIRRREGMGFGDVKMLGMIGAFLGWRGVIATLVLGSLAGALVGLGLFFRGRSMRDTALPFGVFLGLAALVATWAGPALLRLYGL